MDYRLPLFETLLEELPDFIKKYLAFSECGGDISCMYNVKRIFRNAAAAAANRHVVFEHGINLVQYIKMTSPQLELGETRLFEPVHKISPPVVEIYGGLRY